MSETVTHEVEAESHEHPSDLAYVKVALILGAITAVEVLTYFVDFGGALIPSLMVMMVVKFWLVANWFMHLKFDKPIFSRLFVAGLILAVGVYIVALSAFEFWA